MNCEKASMKVSVIAIYIFCLMFWGRESVERIVAMRRQTFLNKLYIFIALDYYKTFIKQ
jgi:hypothetical protein